MKRFFVLIIALVLSVCLAACTEVENDPVCTDETGPDKCPVTEETKGNVPLNTEIEVDWDWPDYDGYEFTFLTDKSVERLISAGEGYSVIDDGLLRRNNILTQKYNVIFTQERVSDLVATVRTRSLGDSVDFNVIMGSAESLSTLAREGLLVDLGSVSRFDMTKNYWDKNAAEQLSVGGKLYFSNSALNVETFGKMLFFNKELIKKYSLANPYELMDKNEWNLTNFMEIAKAVSGDVNRGGQLTDGELGGVLFDKESVFGFLGGAGVRLTSNDKQKEEVAADFDVAKATDVLSRVQNLLETKAGRLIDDIKPEKGYDTVRDYARELYMQDGFIFFSGDEDDVMGLIDMESEYGIVPFPQYDESQGGYYSLYPHDGVMIAIPVGVDNMEMTANIVEDGSYYSRVIMKQAWFEQLLQRRYVLDNESEKSLEILYDNRIYDWGLIRDVGGIRAGILESDLQTLKLDESYGRIKASVEKGLEEYFRDLDGVSKGNIG